MTPRDTNDIHNTPHHTTSRAGSQTAGRRHINTPEHPGSNNGGNHPEDGGRCKLAQATSTGHYNPKALDTGVPPRPSRHMPQTECTAQPGNGGTEHPPHDATPPMHVTHKHSTHTPHTDCIQEVPPRDAANTTSKMALVHLAAQHTGGPLTDIHRTSCTTDLVHNAPPITMHIDTT